MLMSYDTLPNSSMDSSVNPKGENNERIRNGDTPRLITLWGKRGVLRLWDGD
jgi:hypothetical protein